jgi:hypothetical protein
VPLGGAVRVRLAATTAQKQYYALLNLVTAAAAWRLPSRHGLLLHAAGIVLDGRAFVMVGSEGSGKTTWALLASEAGAGVLSDDLVVVERDADGRAQALSTPFRSAQYGTMPPGRWPVAAFLLPAHGPAPALETVSALATEARITANLPFVVDAMGRDARLPDAVERIARSAPARTLVFARDRSFVPLLRAFSQALPPTV